MGIRREGKGKGLSSINRTICLADRKYYGNYGRRLARIPQLPPWLVVEGIRELSCT